MFYVQDIAAESSLELVECIGQFESNLSAQFLALYQVSYQILSHEFFKIKGEGPLLDSIILYYCIKTFDFALFEQ